MSLTFVFMNWRFCKVFQNTMHVIRFPSIMTGNLTFVTLNQRFVKVLIASGGVPEISGFLERHNIEMLTCLYSHSQILNFKILFTILNLMLLVILLGLFWKRCSPFQSTRIIVMLQSPLHVRIAEFYCKVTYWTAFHLMFHQTIMFYTKIFEK
jgi:hypothetical protein